MSSFLTSLNSFLSHTGQLQKVVRNSFSDITSITTVTTVSCFACRYRLDRQNNNVAYTKTFDWEVLFDSTVDGKFGIGDLVYNVINSENRQVIVSGIVEEIQEFSHWDSGLELIKALVNYASVDPVVEYTLVLSPTSSSDETVSGVGIGGSPVG